MRFTSLVFGGAIAILSSCVNLESATDVVQSHAFALDKNNFSDFASTLRDQAFTDHANRKSFDRMRAQLKKEVGIEISKPRFERQEEVDGQKFNLYSVTLSGLNSDGTFNRDLFDYSVRCVVTQSTDWVPHDGSDEPRDENGFLKPGRSVVIMGESCRIAVLRELY
jgi:hypothetical protein